MKYLAILKDSVREAIDAKILYVMLALSGLLVVVVASLTFTPVSVEDDVKHVRDNLNWAMGFRARQNLPALKFDYADFQQQGAGAPWQRDYSFVFVVEFPDEATAREAKKVPDFGPRQIQFILKQQFEYLDNLEVTDAPGKDPTERRFLVTSKGTKIDNVRGWKHEASLLFGLIPLHVGPIALEAPLGGQIYYIEDLLVNGIGAWVAIFAGILITAFFIPNMLRKGTVDLLLVKPIRRPTLLVFKYLGGLTFMLVLSAFTVVGVWLVLGLRSGIWATGFLLTIFVLTFFFAILYSVSTLFGVLTRSPIVAILMTFLVWGVLLAVNMLYVPPDKVAEVKKAESASGQGNEEDVPPAMRQRLLFPDWVYSTVRAVHYVLPRTTDLNNLTSRLIVKGVLLDDNPRLVEAGKTPFTWGESLTVSGIFIAVMLGLASVRFMTQDY